MPHAPLTTAIRDHARRLGFALCGVCPAVPPPRLDEFHRWLADGYAGEMGYLENRRSAYADPRRVLDGARSVVMLGMVYRTVEPPPREPGQGRIARYAWGLDYHDLIHDRLRQLAAVVRAHSPAAAVRGVVDTAPLLEREFAQLAGLGWIGKNTLLLNRGVGSWFFLAALLTSEVLDYDQPWTANHCGTCRACLDACPTGALVAPYRLDARRCISYLTIELRGPVPEDLRQQVAPWLWGCDLCQEVCPWNHRPAATDEPGLRPLEGPVNLGELFYLDDEAFRRRFRRTPLWRAKRRGLLRNAAVVLAGQKHDAAITALRHGLSDPEVLVRDACRWALEQFSTVDETRPADARE